MFIRRLDKTTKAFLHLCYVSSYVGREPCSSVEPRQIIAHHLDVAGPYARGKGEPGRAILCAWKVEDWNLCGNSTDGAHSSLSPISFSSRSHTECQGLKEPETNQCLLKVTEARQQGDWEPGPQSPAPLFHAAFGRLSSLRTALCHRSRTFPNLPPPRPVPIVSSAVASPPIMSAGIKCSLPRGHLS